MIGHVTTILLSDWSLYRTFFFDVHPPLGKMLIAGMGAVTGYNGSFHFSSPNEEYGEHPVYGMRVLCTIVGRELLEFHNTYIWRRSLIVMLSPNKQRVLKTPVSQDLWWSQHL